MWSSADESVGDLVLVAHHAHTLHSQGNTHALSLPVTISLSYICSAEVTAGFQQLSYSVDEDAGTVEACVSIVSPSASVLSTESSVTVSFQNGSATSGDGELKKPCSKLYR